MHSNADITLASLLSPESDVKIYYGTKFPRKYSQDYCRSIQQHFLGRLRNLTFCYTLNLRRMATFCATLGLCKTSFVYTPIQSDLS